VDLSFWVAVTIGLLSAVHCLGMCSGIIGALTFSLPADILPHKTKVFPYVMAYNIGRIGSYALGGALVGGLSGQFFTTLSPRIGYTILQWLSAGVLLAIGLYLAGWFPKLARVEMVGRPFWRRIEPYGRRLLPVTHPLQALFFGGIWGWLPCGLVYTTLIWSASTGNAVDAAWLMVGFGLGTLPATLTAGVLTSWVARLARSQRLRRVAGLTLILTALGTLIYASLHDHRTHVSGHDAIRVDHGYAT